MRLLSLDLERYGPFTGRRLAFRPDARLHLVFGPNEAGKSSSLAAVTDLLFGVKRQTPDDFLRPGKEMRLGATIRDSKGAEISFSRRKLKPLLCDVGNVPLPDDALAPFLGDLSREVFRRAFGLDAEALRRSGDELKASDGELGAALFSAASGLRGISEVKSALEREADGIFAERRAQNRTFYQALDRHEAARKALREHETRAGALKTLREELETQKQRVAEIGERRAAIAVERGRLESLRRAAPILQAIDGDEIRLAALGALPDAPGGAGAGLVEAARAALSALEAQQDAQRREQRLHEEHEAIALDQPLLDRAEEIEQLRTELGAYQKGLLDLPALAREEDAVMRQLAELALRLGLPDGEALLARRPDDAGLARLSALVEAGERLDQARRIRLDELARERGLLDERRHEHGRRGAAMVDPRPLRERLAALADLRRLAEIAHEHAAAIAAETTLLGQQAARLSPPIVDLGALATRSLPSRETIAGFEARIAALDEGLRAERQDLEAASRDGAELAEKLTALAAGAPLPTRQRILSAREQRDRHWQALRAGLFGEALFGPALAAAMSGFVTARSEADALADAAIGDAQRVAAHDEASRARLRSETLAARHRQQLDAIDRQRQDALADWAQIWLPSGLVPGSPSEMMAWLQAVATLLERHGRLAERREQERGIVAEIDGARPALAALTAELGLSAMPGLSIAAELKRAETELDRMAQDWEAASNAQTLLADLERRAGNAELAAEALQAQLDDWQQALRVALPLIGLPESAGVAEVQASLAAWRDLPALVGERDSLKRRIEGIRRDVARFAREVAALAAEVAPDLAGAAEPVLRQIGERLTLMRDARTRREAMARRVAEAQAATLTASDVRDKAARALAALADGLGLAPEAALAEIGAALAERDAIVARLHLRRNELSNATDGRDEVDLREALAGYESEAALAEIARLEQEASRLESESQEAYAAAREAGAKIDGLGGIVAAELAMQQRRGAESELLEAAREWTVLSVGALMIGTAIARQRQSRQEPLMARAGAFFATLTGGAFSGLGQSFDAEDMPHLVGRRASDAELQVAAMSEGTRDQLYLALRLAYLEDYAARAEPPPFLADDLFASFDDARTVNGLKALAEIGASVQPILFTHHRFVVEAATRELGDAVDVLELE
jgi:uncharacterized protein YhaN